MSSTTARSLMYCILALGIAGMFLTLHAAKADATLPDDMAGHMTMTKLRPAQPGDQERADAIAVAARKFAERYVDYKKALAEGYTIFAPEVPQHVYHFTLDAAAIANEFKFDPNRPTSLLYEKTANKDADGKPGYKLVGVMYTAPYRSSEEALDERVPLSVAQWHLHTNLCLPPRGEQVDVTAADAKFGLRGAITTAEACRAAGGRFMPHLFGWMVHVYPFETDKAKVWAAGMDDDHGMQHDAMPGMKMDPNMQMGPM